MLAVRTRASKRPVDYDRETRTVAALRRRERQGLPCEPGRDVRYVVVDDDARGAERVRLPFEECAADYDVAFYVERLLRAAEEVVSPLGWDRRRIDRYRRRHVDVGLAAFE